MSETKDGGPAFPVHGTRFEGMSLRDAFAIAALQGMLAGADAGARTNFAQDAYKLADAMLKAREARHGK